MFNWLLAINLAIAVLLIAIGLLAFVKNAKSALNVIFLLFTSSMALWLVANYYSNDTDLTHFIALQVNHLTLFFPAVLVASMAAFMSYLTGRKQFIQRWGKTLTYINAANALLSLSPYVITDVSVAGSNFKLYFGPLAGVYFTVLLCNIAAAIWFLVSGFKRARGSDRAKLTIISWSVCAAVAVNILTNILLPFFADVYVLTAFGPISTLLIAVAFYYSVARHRLFDIRPVIIRSLGYIVTIVLVSSLYGFVIFSVAGLIFRLSLPWAAIVFLSIATGLLSLAFIKIKQYVDRVTNSFFFRDAYDSGDFLDAFNKALVSTIDVNQLLQRASLTITKYVKVQYCLIGLIDGSVKGYRLGGGKTRVFDDPDVQQAAEVLSTTYGATIIADELAEGSDLRRLLLDNNIAAIVRLSAGTHKDYKNLGYLALGPKKSGNPFAASDLRDIETAANELVIALQNALRFEEIQQFNETLQQRVTDATLKLKKTNEKLRAMDETKDDFISMASHQMRTPLTSVKGYLSLVLEGDAGTITPVQRKLLGQAFTSSQRMVYLIADLLNVSRLKTGKFVIEKAPINLAEVVAGEIDQLTETAAARGLTLEYKRPSQFPTVELDETKTRQVIMNFVDNAIYYTPSGGHITVSLADQPKTIELKVSDDGIGVPKHEQHHLFSKFYRAKNAQKARPDGTGLGLFMARKVIVAQEGAIIFNSSEGKGSTFGFTLPKNAPPSI